jgi:hypothetical protein
MVVRASSLFPVLGVPLLGLGVMLSVGLRRSAPPSVAARTESTPIYLVAPDPKMNRSFSIFLKQEAREVALCRRGGRRPEAVAQAVAGYNLIAQECTPAVFQETGLPPSLKR